MTGLVLGPVLRYVDDTSATVWVETESPCTVEVLGCSTRTFQVGGHFYALVPVRGLQPGSSTPYDVRLDGVVAWSIEASSKIRTIPQGKGTTLRLLFGSCRFGPTNDVKHSAALGPDALTAYAKRLATSAEDQWPDTMLLLGDQVYADQTTPQVQQELRAKRDLTRPPGTEIADFEEYTYLYRHSWGEPDIRWLMSTVPTMMIFDDHDVRDDWNTSHQWRRKMAREPWWRERLIGGLASYWIYQHLGNLGPDELDHNETYRQVLEASRTGDALPVLREFATRSDEEINGAKPVRWSYRRDLGPARVVVLDTRAGRILDSGKRAMLSDKDFEWLRESTANGSDHLVLASSLPWLLPPAVHHVQSWNEAACERGGRWSKPAERIRQIGDLEHWAAFRASFDRLSRVIGDAAQERSGADTYPSSISVLSGDVHHSYLAEAHYPGRTRSRIVQVTCSPLHNAVPQKFMAPLRFAWRPRVARALRRAAEWAGVPPLPLSWSKTDGPYFGNAVGTVEFRGRSAQVTLLRADDTDTLTPICHRTLS